MAAICALDAWLLFTFSNAPGGGRRRVELISWWLVPRDTGRRLCDHGRTLAVHRRDLFAAGAAAASRMTSA